MSNIASLFTSRGNGPYDKGFTAQVIAVADVVKYKGKDGKDKEALTAILGDASDLVKMTCYDPNKFRFFKIDKTIMLKNIIKKTEDRAVVVTTPSKVAFWAPLGVTFDEKKAEANRMLNPPPAAVVDIKAALDSPKRKKNSVRGRLIQEEETRTVKSNGEEVLLKNITLEDQSCRAKVTLWRDLATSPVKTGDFVIVTDLQVNNYLDTISLSSTMRSTLTKVEAPIIEEVVTVAGVALNNDTAELYLDGDVTEITVPAELLQMAVGEDNIESLCEAGPFSLKLIRKGSDIVEVERV